MANARFCDLDSTCLRRGFALGVTQILLFVLGVTQILAFLDTNMLVSCTNGPTQVFCVAVEYRVYSKKYTINDVPGHVIT